MSSRFKLALQPRTCIALSTPAMQTGTSPDLLGPTENGTSTPLTREKQLIISKTDTVKRPWY
jgi:hypothetical protein